MDFKKPGTEKDWAAGLAQLGTFAAKVKFQDPISALEQLPKAWQAWNGKAFDTAEAKVWRFITECVAIAFGEVLREPKLHCPLTEEELASQAREFLQFIPESGKLRPIDVTNLALSPVFEVCTGQVIDAVTKAAPEHKLSEETILYLFRSELATAGAKALARDTGTYSFIFDVLKGPASVPEEREIAWNRHAAWVQSLFHLDPIFSPDGDEEIPLSKVYMKLRCHWNTIQEQERDDGQENGLVRDAHVADLHEKATDWLANSTDSEPLLVVAGGPGCGKSSFARAFACEVLQKRSWRVIFVRLQHLRTVTDRLYDTIGAYLKSNHGWKNPTLCEGFPENPLDWHGESSENLLMVFDGLDELSADEETAKQYTNDFLFSLKRLLEDLERKGNKARAIVLGRTIAAEEACKQAELPLETTLHVAPIRPMTPSDLRLEFGGSTDTGARVIHGDHSLIEKDERESYWNRWCQIKGREPSEIPRALVDDSMRDLNVEPLLLHLLIISDYCGDRWEEAASNPNLVYEDILTKIYDRNKEKMLEVYRHLTLDDFFVLMEVFGLSAMRNNGRTGTHEVFQMLRGRYAPEKEEEFKKLLGAQLKNVALQVHARKDVEGAGFEFVHKSFGEYLAGRALIGAAKGVAEVASSRRSVGRFEKISAEWVSLIGQSELTHEILSFLNAQAKLVPLEERAFILEKLTPVLDWALEHGFPVHLDADLHNPDYFQLVDLHSCAELTMLAVLTSLQAAKNECPQGGGEYLQLSAFTKNRNALSQLFGRSLRSQKAISPLGRMIHDVNLEAAIITFVNLRFASLRNVCMRLASLSNSDFRRAVIRNTILEGAVLSQANMQAVDVKGVDARDVEGYELSMVNSVVSDSDFSRSVFQGSSLFSSQWSNVNLNNVDFRVADFRRAAFDSVEVVSANFQGCNLGGSRFWNVDFSDSLGLTQSQIESTFGVKSGPGKTFLPVGIHAPDHWIEIDEGVEDQEELRILFGKVYNNWIEEVQF